MNDNVKITSTISHLGRRNKTSFTRTLFKTTVGRGEGVMYGHQARVLQVILPTKPKKVQLCKY